MHQNPTDKTDELPPLEIRHGIKALAKFIRKTDAQTQYLLEKGAIPAKKLGGRWTWSPEKVRAHLMEGM